MTCLVYTVWIGTDGKGSAWACQVHSSAKEEEEKSWVIPVREGSLGAVETQFVCPSRALKEGKGPRCAGCDLKPEEDMGTTCSPFPM